MKPSSTFLARVCTLPLLALGCGCGAPSAGTPPTGSSGASLSLKFLRTVVVIPDAEYQHGGFVRINYVSATDRFLVTFAATSATVEGSSDWAYKEYTTDMVETGRKGRFLLDQSGDMGSALLGNTYYFVTFPGFSDGPANGWRMRTYDATTMRKQADVFLSLPGDTGHYQNNDPMVVWANGQLDVSCQYNALGSPPEFFSGSGTYHLLLDSDLRTAGEKRLTDTPHIGGSYMVYVDGVYHLVSARAFLGADLIAMRYDSNWGFLGSKNLGVEPAHWSTGLAHENGRFYVAYLDNGRWAFPAPKIFPIYLNAHLGVFDRDWNRIADVAATDFSPSDSRAAGRPWVLVHKNRAYLAYDVDRIDPNKVPAEQFESQSWISIYEIVTGAPGQ